LAPAKYFLSKIIFDYIPWGCRVTTLFFGKEQDKRNHGRRQGTIDLFWNQNIPVNVTIVLA
jgi:hypothetical protein